MPPAGPAGFNSTWTPPRHAQHECQDYNLSESRSRFNQWQTVFDVAELPGVQDACHYGLVDHSRAHLQVCRVHQLLHIRQLQLQGRQVCGRHHSSTRVCGQPQQGRLAYNSTLTISAALCGTHHLAVSASHCPAKHPAAVGGSVC